ncbi:MAG: MFS transporter [Planctomycetota bacterium]
MESKEPLLEVKKLDPSLIASIKDVAFYGMMVGCGEAYLMAYAIKHLDVANRTVGLLSILGPALGIITQVWCANLMERKPRRRALYLAGVLVQCLAWPILAVSVWLSRDLALWTLVACLVAYFGSGHFAAPAWNSVMGDLVPFDLRGRYFAYRNRVCIFFQWSSAVLGGFALEWFELSGHARLGFFVTFMTAALARVISMYYLSQMKEPEYRPREEDSFSFRDFIRRLPHSNFGKFTVFVSLLSFSVNFSGPYFSVYLLRDLHFSYIELMGGEAMLYVGQLLWLSTWGPIADKFGNKRILALCGVGIILLPTLWIWSQSKFLIYSLQLLGGILWSGFNLCVANFLLDAVSPPKRARCVAYFNMFNSTGVLLGGFTGAWFVEHLPTSFLGWTPYSPLYWIMILSGVMRVFVMVFCLPTFKEVRDVSPISTLGLVFRATHLKGVADLAMDRLSGYLRGGRREGEKW